ncbi:hypothetical protein PY254_10670 [Rhodanobacter sp. AS-Z3]|uniref:hypothetical protein n=1 Tax=Rhodanobacter sp. AS-Z3 TaxID=3031330 RepID=UPI0024791AE5|nr:hypothetical protein [Rhodanobacter sp. AS-Z3]WEN13708.1 hypothetical protein PY254_10670 [Rhodanobacter sp. AS-Z3]
MSPPVGALSGLELIPLLQGAANAGLPLLAAGALPKGTVLQLRRPFAADLSATADADPGAGKLRWNNAAPASATMLYIDNVDGGATSIAAAWASLNVGGFVYVQGVTDAARGNWQKWQVASVATGTGYAKIGVSLQASAGTFADTDPVELTLQQPTPSPGIDRGVLSGLSIASGVVNIDCSLGDYFTLAHTANVTSLTFSNLPAAGMARTLMVRIKQDGTGGRTFAMPASFKAITGSDTAVQSAANAYTILAITTFDQGTRWEYSMKAGAA